ncbi:MAG: formyltransferase family protein [Allosphingosinicella sp.]
MRIALAGQRSFGAAALRAIVDAGHEVRQVFAPLGDRLDWDARRLDIPTADRLVADALEPNLDLIVCAHAHVFVSERARGRTQLGGIGYHPSLLPRHRGRDAVRWTVHMGDPIAGGSVYWLTNRVDGGPIAAADWCLVRPGTSASALWREQLFPMGIRLLVRALADLDRGIIVRVQQDEACATWEPSWDRPPVERPDLPQLTHGGDRVAERFTIVTSRDAA